MSVRESQVLGATSLLAAISAGLFYIGLAVSDEPHLNLIFVFFGLGVLGVISGLTGMFFSQGRGRILPLVGFVLSIPSAVLGLMLTAVIFGQRH